MRKMLSLVIAACAVATGASACEVPASFELQQAGLIAPLEAQIGAGFGLYLHPILQIRRQHYGVDFIAGTGEPITAVASGRVVEAKYQGAYGNTVRIEHGGEIATLYAHLSRYADRLAEGTCVKAGDVIGFVGSSGLSSQPHLHFEVHRAGEPIDPAPFLGVVVTPDAAGRR